MDGNASFGYWVRRQRKALDLTQAELAHRVGCAEGTIRMIEADARRPSRQIAARLADHLAIPHADRTLFIQIARSEASTGWRHWSRSTAAAPTCRHRRHH